MSARLLDILRKSGFLDALILPSRGELLPRLLQSRQLRGERLALGILLGGSLRQLADFAFKHLKFSRTTEQPALFLIGMSAGDCTGGVNHFAI